MSFQEVHVKQTRKVKKIKLFKPKDWKVPQQGDVGLIVQHDYKKIRMPLKHNQVP